MSGGHFGHSDYRIEDIACAIEELIRQNDDKTLDEWGNKRGRGYNKKTIKKFQKAVETLRLASKMAHRIDWLASGDDGEDTFEKAWKEEIGRWTLI